MHRTCRLNHITSMMSHEGHTAGIVIHRMPLVSVTMFVDDILGTHKQKSVLPHKWHAGRMTTRTHTVFLVTAKGGKEFSSGEKWNF